MIRIQAYAIGVFVVGLLSLGAASAGSAGHLQIEGEWSLTAREGERVQLTLHWRSKDQTMSSITEWSLDRLEGLSLEQLHSDGTPVRFRILREAGALTCEGHVKSGSGQGVFTLIVSRSFLNSRTDSRDSDVAPRYVPNDRAT